MLSYRHPIDNDVITAAVGGRTLATVFLARVDDDGARTALCWREASGSTRTWSWAEYADAVGTVAASFAKLGVTRGSTAVLMMENRPEFHVADTALFLSCVTPISIYSTSSTPQVEHIVRHSGARVAVVAPEHVHHFRGLVDELELVVVLDDDVDDGEPGVPTVAYSTLVDGPRADLRALAAEVTGDDLVTIIYTSGTTGPPKAVPVTHANIVWLIESLRVLLEPRPGLRMLSYGPMAHAGERMMSHYQHMGFGTEVTILADSGALEEAIVEVQPHYFFAPPRLFQKMQARHLSSMTADERHRLDDALATGATVAARRAAGAPLEPDLAARWEAADVMLAPLREAMGLGAGEFVLMAAAWIPPDLLGFYRALGVPVAPAYGLSESTGCVAWDPVEVRHGTVGRPIPGSAVRIAPDGEIEISGGHVFRGYVGDTPATAAALGSDGWLRTGDVGTLDDDGYITILDRKKDLIVTSGGKNIAPALIEARLRHLDLVGDACVVGDGRPYVVCLLTLDPSEVKAWAADRALDRDDVATLIDDPALLDDLVDAITEMNRDVSRPERVKRFTVVPDQWLLDSGLVTPTMKLKRTKVITAYASDIEALYGAEMGPRSRSLADDREPA